MNARQAKRVVLWMNGHYLISADHYGLDDDQVDAMSEADLTRLGQARRDLGLELIRRSGLPADLDPRDVLASTVEDAGRGQGRKAGCDEADMEGTDDDGAR